MKKLLTILLIFCAGKLSANEYFFNSPFELAKVFTNTKAFATTWYIDPGGDDVTGNGSIGNPWKTLYKATSTVTTIGDSIHVNAGTYNETIQCPLSPGVSIGGADSSLSIITSTLTSAFTPIIYAGSAQGTNGNQRISGLKFIGNTTCQMAIVVGGRSNVHIYNCRFYTFNDRGVVFSGRSDWGDGAPSTYSSGNKFYNNFIYDCARSDLSYGRGNLETGGQIGLEIYNDTIIQPARASNLSGYCIKNVNQGFLKGMKIHNNYLEVPPYPYATPNVNNHWSFATEFSDIMGLEYYNNRVLGSADQNHTYPDSANGYNFGAWYHDNIFGFNTLQSTPIEGIIFEYHCKEAIVEGNTFKNTTIPLYFTPRPGSQIRNLIFRNNYCPNVGSSAENNYAQGIKINTSQPPLIAYRWKVYNNTFIANTTLAPGYGVDIPPGDSMYFVNNIVRGFGNDVHIYGAANNRFFVSQNNNFITSQIVGTLPATAVVNGNINTAPNLDANGIPNAGSPMIDAGVYSNMSYYGVKRDIGSGEYPTAGNAHPSAIVPYSRRLIQPLSGLAVVGYGYDPDGTISTKTWSQVSGPVSVSFTSANSFSTTITGMSAIGDYVIRLTVVDNSGATSYSDFTISVVAAGSNALPTVTASANQTITLASVGSTGTVSISIVDATDSDGSVVSYQSNILSGSGVITTPTAQNTTVTGLTVGTTTIEVTGTDNDDGIGRDTLTITVQPPTVTVVTSVAPADTTITVSTISLVGYGIAPTSGGYNRFLYSEQLNNAAWGGNSIGVTANASGTMEEINILAPSAYWGQTISVTPGETIYVSFRAARGTATNLKFGIWNNSAFNNIIEPTDYYDLLPATGSARVQFSVLIPAGTTTVTPNLVYNSIGTGTVFIGDAQFALASNHLYVTTTTAAYTAGNTTGTITGYLWNKVSGPAGDNITSSTSASTGITGLSTGTYQYRLRVTDNLGAQAYDTVQVIVNLATYSRPRRTFRGVRVRKL